MYKINIENLLETLENVDKMHIVIISEDIKAHTGLALDRFLAL